MTIDQPAQEPPIKRRRLSIGMDGTVESEEISPAVVEKAEAAAPPPVAHDVGAELSKETRAGISAFVNPDAPGFSGILKQRYTDFLVNEILIDGRVLHLSNLSPPKRQKVEKGAFESAKPALEPAVNSENANSVDDGQKIGLENGHPTSDQSISENDNMSLTSVFGDVVGAKIVSLYQAILQHPSRRPKDFKSVTSELITDKEKRTETHQLIRRIFKSKLETTTANNETILITAAPAMQTPRGGAMRDHGPRINNKLGWQELGGDYLHFSLYKENKDTMEVLSYLSRELKVSAKHFQFGGTKDRRAVTVQRCSAYRVRAEQLSGMNRKLRGSKVGDYEHGTTGMELGDLSGNEFVITLRDCHVPNDDGLGMEDRIALAERVLTESVGAFKQGGFLNYYGLQRFGSFATSTDEVGLKLLQGNLSSAVADILAFNPVALEDSDSLISSDDRARAQALHLWNTTKNSSQALQKLPRKFSAESSIIRHLGVRNKDTGALNNTNDFQGALQTIPRNLRLMYVHAYQSRVWNIIAGKRWELYGARVVEGDLVMVSEHTSSVKEKKIQPTLDDQGEPIVLASASEGAGPASGAEDLYERARPLSAEEAASGSYTIFDVVLPLPGYDVVYPPNATGEEYKTLMGSESGGGLDPYDMRRSWKDLSLSGSYRKMLAMPGQDLTFEIKTYERAEEQLVETDLERLQKRDRGSSTGEQAEKDRDAMEEIQEVGDAEKKLAIILRMRLGSSQYATMALRELMKQGGMKTYKPDYGSGR